MSIDKKEYDFSDDDVILSVKNGRTADFEVILKRYNKRIINFVYKMTGDYDESLSIAQDVFFKIFKKLDKYKANGTFPAFLFTIARNMTLNHIKKTAKVLSFSVISEKGDGDHLQAEDATPPEKIEKDEKDEMISAGLLQLNVNQRLALIMKVYLRYSYKQIGEMTGWSQPKIETLISRGKVNLKKYVNLQETEGEDV